MDYKKIKKTAIDEILNPSHELSKQYLESIDIFSFEDIPVIEDIEINGKENTASVYFKVVDEEFYFVVYIDLFPKVEVRWVNLSPGSMVYLYVTSEVLSLEELVGSIGFEPTEKWTMNDKREIGRIKRHNGFKYKQIEKKTGELEEKLSNLIDFLLPYKEQILNLSKKASVGIRIVYYGHKDEMWGIYFRADNINKLSELGISIDIDIYASGVDIE